MEQVPASAVAALRQRGWCVLKLPPEAQRTVEVANDEATAFFAQAEGYKARFRRAAEEGGGDDGEGELGGRRVKTGGVGYLQGGTREWLHLAADDRTLASMRWPSAALRDAALALLALLRHACEAVLAGLEPERLLLESHRAQAARWGDPSVLDLFRYHNAAAGEGAAGGAEGENMASHSDPGLLTATPVSSVPGLELFDEPSGRWVDVECGAGGDDLVVFMGDQWEESGAAGAGGAGAVEHRVRRAEGPRLSLVFEMRTWDVPEREEEEEEEPEEEEEEEEEEQQQQQQQQREQEAKKSRHQ